MLFQSLRAGLLASSLTLNAVSASEFGRFGELSRRHLNRAEDQIVDATAAKLEARQSSMRFLTNATERKCGGSVCALSCSILTASSISSKIPPRCQFRHWRDVLRPRAN